MEEGWIDVGINRTLAVAGIVAGAAAAVYRLRQRCAENRRSREQEPGSQSDPLHPVDPSSRSGLLGRTIPFRRSGDCPVTNALASRFQNLRRNRNPRSHPRSIKGKVVLVAGGSRGLGLALAEEFGRHGARLVLAARNAEELDRAREKLLGRGVPADDVIVIPFDATDSAQTQTMAQEATRRFRQIDVLVNCIGTITVGPVENQPEQAFKDAIESNYYSMLHTTLAVLPQMLARRDGSIVNIVSIGGKIAVPHLLPYSASKFAALGFSQGLHAELRSKGISVTTVCPGLMRTGSHVHARFTGDQKREYRWFSLAASMPIISASAKRAARKVVYATIYGQTEITITPQAFLIGRLAQALPEPTATVMHWVNSLVLPGPVEGGESSSTSGEEVRGKEANTVTLFGRYAGRRYNQGSA